MAISGMGYNSSKSSTDVWGPQKPFLQDIYGAGQSLYQQQAGQAGPAAQGFVDQMMPGLNAGFASLGGLADPTAQIAAQEQSLATGLGNLWKNEINPAIGASGVGAGGFGGGRHGVAQGVAAGELGNAYTQGLGDITARANMQASQAAQSMPQYAAQTMNLGMSPFQAAFAPLQNYGALVGGPAMTSQSESSGYSMGF